MLVVCVVLRNASMPSLNSGDTFDKGHWVVWCWVRVAEYNNVHSRLGGLREEDWQAVS